MSIPLYEAETALSEHPHHMRVEGMGCLHLCSVMQLPALKCLDATILTGNRSSSGDRAQPTRGSHVRRPASCAIRLSIFSRTGKESSGDGFHLHSGADINLCLTNLLFIAYLACILAPGMGRDCRICPSLQGLLLQGKASGSDRRLPSLQEVLLCLKAHMSRKQLNVMPGRLREPTNKAL